MNESEILYKLAQEFETFYMNRIYEGKPLLMFEITKWWVDKLKPYEII